VALDNGAIWSSVLPPNCPDYNEMATLSAPIAGAEGDGVCQFIQCARLERSVIDLANPFLRTESLNSIA